MPMHEPDTVGPGRPAALLQAVAQSLPPTARCAGIVEPPDSGAPLSDDDIALALSNPVQGDRPCLPVHEVVKPGDSVCIVVSDQTRHTAADRVLPVMLESLEARGCEPGDMAILVATGIHRPPTPAELGAILGSEVAERFQGRVFVHDPDDERGLVTVGTTGRGQPVRVNRRAINADRLVVVGAATFHYHAGFGGGRKSLVPGLAARETIAFNHSLTLAPGRDALHPGAAPGLLDGNPVSEEMFEAAAMCDPDIIVNTVLSPSGDLVGVFSGDLDAAHRAACRLVESVCRVDLAAPADLVVAFAEDAPDWVQAHKALYNAHRAVSAEGWKVLVAGCTEGLGNERLRHWLKRPGVADIYRGLRESPEVNGQTALSTRVRGQRTTLVSGLPPHDVADLGMGGAPDLHAALQAAVAGIPASTDSLSYYVMPSARYTLPFLPEGQGNAQS